MMRAILLMMVSLGSVVNGIFVYGQKPTDIEKTGWAYQYLGENGVSEAMIGMGVVFFLFGSLLVRDEWKKYKKGKTMNWDA